MTIEIDRRSLIRAGAYGLGALSLPGGAAAIAQAMAARGFTHDVASGEPRADSVLLWTRYVPASGDSAHVHAEISETENFARPVSGGTVITGAFRDWTARVTVDGLKPGRTYFYRFVANGETSPVGRTRTLPVGHVGQWRMAIFSCANLPYGWFNAYAHAAARDDLDMWLHLGDYFYEYKIGTYPSLAESVPARILEPTNELIHLADYRLRYACYRADPDLQALHRRLPMLAQVDDHETANDSWEGGAENHQPDEGDYQARKAAAMQAWHEWMPVSDQPWATYDFGDLATFFRTETRLIARTKQPDLAPFFKEADPIAALKAFRDGAWQDPAATMMGTGQENWLAHVFRASVASGRRWQLAGIGTVMGNLKAPAEAGSWLAPDAPDYIRKFVSAGVAAGKVGLPLNYDSWGGYPAARARFLRAAEAAAANLLVVTGDSHNAWAFELSENGRVAGIEFGGHSVSSPGYESAVAVSPDTVARALVAANPELKWCEIRHRGYMALTLTPEAATNEWLFLDTVRDRSTRLAGVNRIRVTAGRRRLEPA